MFLSFLVVVVIYNIHAYIYNIYTMMIYGLNDLSYGVGDIYQADIRRHDNLSSIARFHTNHWKRRHIREFSQNGRLDKYH